MFRVYAIYVTVHHWIFISLHHHVSEGLIRFMLTLVYFFMRKVCSMQSVLVKFLYQNYFFLTCNYIACVDLEASKFT